MEELLKKFALADSDPLAWAREWKKKTQGKVVGCMGLFVPEEMIHAAGMLPVVVLEKEAPIQKAQAHIQNVMCGYIRSVVDQSVIGDLDFLDCLVAHDACHVIRMMLDIMTRNSKIKRLEPLFFPVTLKKTQSWTFLLKELVSYRKRMEEVGGVEITDEKLKASIALFNKHRQLLKEVYRLRREKPGLLTAVQVSQIVKSSMLMSKEEHNALLEELIAKMTAAQAKKSDKVPVVLSASLCETCDEYLLKAIEESGAMVVDDDLYVGSRYFSTEVDESMPPMEAMAMAYTHMESPCPTRFDPDNDWGRYLADMVKKTGAKGVITVMVKFCEAHGYGYFIAKNHLKELDIPEYLLETEHELYSVEQAKTRIQGFVESLAQ